MDDEAPEETHRLLANPGDPTSPFVFGTTRYLALKIRRGPVLRHLELAVVGTSVSVVTAMPALVCVATGTAGIFEQGGELEDPVLAAPLTVLNRPDQRVRITVPVLNRGTSGDLRPSLRHPIRLAVFAIPLAAVSPNISALIAIHDPDSYHASTYSYSKAIATLYHLQRTGRGHRKRADIHITRHSQTLTVRLVTRQVRWEILDDTPVRSGDDQKVTSRQLSGGAKARTVCVATVPAHYHLEHFDGIRLQRVSCSGVRLNAACFVPEPQESDAQEPSPPAPSYTLVIMFYYYPDEPGAPEKPPSSFVGHFLIYRHGGEIMLTAVPHESMLGPLPLNGFAVRLPHQVTLPQDGFWDLHLPGTFFTNPMLNRPAVFEGIFFPHTDVNWSARIAVWRQGCNLTIRLLGHGQKTVRLPPGLEIGTIRFFEDNPHTYQRSEISTFSAYALRAHIRGSERRRPTDWRPVVAPQEPRDDTRASDEQDSWWTRWRQQRLASAAPAATGSTGPTGAAAAPTPAPATRPARRHLEQAPAPAEHSLALRQLALQRTQIRHSGPVTPRPRHDDIVGRPLWTQRMEYVTLQFTEQQRGHQQLWLALEPRGPAFAIQQLIPMAFTIHTDGLHVPCYFPPGGIAQFVVSVDDARGRFLTQLTKNPIPTSVYHLRAAPDWSLLGYTETEGAPTRLDAPTRLNAPQVSAENRRHPAESEPMIGDLQDEDEEDTQDEENIED